MTHLTSSLPSRRPRCLRLFAGTALPGRALRISHVHRVTLMTCRALRLRGCPTLLPKVQCRIVSSGFVRSSTIPNIVLTELYHFSPKAYGLSPLCLRLTRRVTHTGPRLDTMCGGSPLLGRHFQPLVIQRLVAHDKLTSQIEKTPVVLVILDHSIFPRRKGTHSKVSIVTGGY